MIFRFLLPSLALCAMFVLPTIVQAAYVFDQTWGWGVTDGTNAFQICMSASTCQAGLQGSGNGEYNSSFGIALDSFGNVYVSDTNNNRIQKFDSSGTFITKWGSAGSGNGQFNTLTGIALDSSDNVYAVDLNNRRIQKFDSSGSFIRKWGSLGSGNGQFNNPSEIAIDSADNVYVTDQQNHRVEKFDSSGAYLSQWGSSGSGNGQFQFPADIAVGSSGNVYVADPSNHLIQKFDSSGTYLSQWGTSGSGDGQLNYPFSIAIDSSGNVYVGDLGDDSVKKFDASGTFITKWGNHGSGNGEFIGPIGIAADSLGNIYVLDSGNNRIQKFSNLPITSPTVNSSTPSNINAASATLNGNITATGRQNATEHGFTWSTTPSLSGGDTATTSLGSKSGTGSFSSSLTGLIPNTTYYFRAYATNSGGTGLGTIENFTTLLVPTAYQYVSQFGGTGSGNGQFSNPYDIAISTTTGNTIYVVENGNSRIQKFDSEGTFITKWGANFGLGNGQFSYPYGIATDSSGNVYLADRNNNRIQKFDSSGAYVSKWGSVGSGSGQFFQPFSLALDPSGNVYVADTYNHRIQKFNSSGAYVSQWGSFGSGNGQFQYTNHVAADSFGNVYVDDTTNNRIQKFNSSGVYISQWGSSGSGNGQFNQPNGIAVDSSGNVYVADTQNHRIQKFDSSGTYLSQWGSQGSGNGQFQNPYGIALDLSGNVYVSDVTGNRIQKFSDLPVASPTVSTSPSSSITTAFATLSGSINNTGGQDTTEHGFIWGTEASLSGGDTATITLGAQVGAGSFSSNVTGLTPNTTYYFRAYATNSAGTGLGTIETFDTLPITAPTITTSTASSLSTTGATLNGAIDNTNGDDNITEHGFAWGTVPTLTGGDTATTTLGAQSGTGSFSSNISGLIPNTTYYFQAYATNGVGTGLGIIKTLKTASLNAPSFDSFVPNVGLSRPGYIGVAANGEAYISETNNYRVAVFNPDHSFKEVWGWGVKNGTDEYQICTAVDNRASPCQSGIQGGGAGAFSNPFGMTVDRSGNVYVTDTSNNRIQKFSSSGEFLFMIGAHVNSSDNGDFCNVAADCQAGLQASLGGEFSSPYNLANDASGNIYVADLINHRIQKFSSSGAFISMWGWDVNNSGGTGFEVCTIAANCQAGAQGGGAGQFNFPDAMGVDSAQNIYVVDESNYRIQKFSSSGAFISTFGWNVDGSNTFPGFEVCAIAANCQAGTQGGHAGQFSDPIGIAFDPNGTIYVTDDNNDNVQSFSTAGVFRASWGFGVKDGIDRFEICTRRCRAGSANHQRQGEFNSPFGIAVDLTHNVYVVNPNDSRIQILSSAGAFLGGLGGQSGFFSSRPIGVSYDSNGNVYVGDEDNMRVGKFDSKGNFLFSFGQNELSCPFGVTVNAFQDVAYVVDNCSQYVYAYNDIDGSLIDFFGKDGIEGSNFADPEDITLDPDGNVYVVDDSDVRIYKFDSAGNAITSFTDSSLSFPFGIALGGDGNLYVTDQDNDNVAIFDQVGNYISSWGTGGDDEGQLDSPLGITFDKEGNAFIAEHLGCRVQSFTKEGVFLFSMNGPGYQDNCGSDPGQFNNFTYQFLDFDSAGNLYVPDSGNSRVEKFRHASP